MARDTDRYRLLTRRTIVLGGIKLSLFSVLVSRLYYLQIVEADKYKTLAEENRISLRLIAPKRGLIIDRFGTTMAANQQNFRAVLVPEQVPDVDVLLGMASKILPIEESDIKRIHKEIRANRSFTPVLVRDNLTWDQVAAIELNTPDLPGLSIEAGEVRGYPFGSATAHILGYVGPVSESEAGDDPLLSLPTFRIGKSGIERQYESILRGKPGNVQLEVNALGRVVRELNKDDGQAGQDITLTIDSGLQQFAQQRLGTEMSAAAVVMDVHTGGLFAMASSPGFDPNQFSVGINNADWATLSKDERKPLINKPVSGLYAPGSTFKTVVALAALESGIIDADHTVHCPGFLDFGDHRFHCWKKEGHGTLDMVHGIMHSCDTYFYDVARRIGIDRIHAMAERFGLNQKLGIDLPGEKAGIVPNRAWKLAHRGVAWQQGENLVAGIGQGYILTTPLQLATLAARLANGGKAVVPHILRRTSAGISEPSEWPDMGVSADFLAVVKAGMNAVSNVAGGTAFGSRITEAGFELAGKTGTSQVRRISAAERATGVIPNEKRPWEDRDHALFIGFAPVSNPRFSIAVVVEHGGGGSKAAAPIARDILLECQKRNIGKA